MRTILSHLFRFRLFALCLAAAVSSAASAQDSSALLTDRNGDGILTLYTFGDSITYGVGDGVPAGNFVEEVPLTDGTDGYPARVRSLLGISVLNGGVPGEIFTEDGVQRFPQFVFGGSADLVAVMEGANDAIFKTSGLAYELALQRVVNTARVLGIEPLLLTLPKPCCDHEALGLFTGNYNNHIKNVAVANDATLVDIERAWQTTCKSAFQCELYNLPEGLHPNTRGYTVMAQTLAAALLGIDIFAPDGAALLEEVLVLEPGSVIVRPDPNGLEE